MAASVSKGIIIIIMIFIEDINFTDKWFTKESSKIKKDQKGKIKTNIWLYKNETKKYLHFLTLC